MASGSRINDPQFQGTDNVIDGYNSINKGAIYWSVWNDEKCTLKINCCLEGTKEECEEELRDWVEKMEENKTRNIYVMRTHFTDIDIGELTAAAPYKSCLTFRPSPWDPQKYTEENRRTYLEGGGNNKQVLEALNGISSRLAALEQDDPQDEHDSAEIGQIQKYEGIINGINTLVGNPFISQLLSKLVPMAAETKPAQVAGISDTDINLQDAINILAKHDEHIVSDLWKLAQIAEKKPLSFKVMIAELRDYKI
jgi:hypothetical protein